MADHLSDIQNQIVNKNKNAVEALLGAPIKTSNWKKGSPPQGANAQAIANFEATELDEIWIYSNGRVHFSISGLALKVDDNVARDLPPDNDTLLV